MATKRAKRIDPSEAFASIVGGPAEEAPEQAAPPAPEPQPAPTQTPVAFQAAPDPVVSVPAPVVAPEAGEAAASLQPPVPPPQQASPIPAPATPSPTLPKLVQKGYYLREDQAKQLGIYAAITGADKSSVIRAALDEYFQNHPAGV